MSGPVLEIERGNYFSRIWFMGNADDPIDVLAALTRRLPDGPWILKFRLRKKRDGVAFESLDEKTIWTVTFPPETPESAAVRKVGPVLQKMKVMTRLKSFDCTTIESDDPALIVHLLRSKPWFNVKFEETPS